MLTFLRWLVRGTANYWDAVSAIVGWLWTIGGGIVTGWAAWWGGIFSQYAPLSWVIAGLFGAILAAMATMIFGIGRYQLARASAMSKWSRQTDALNPLDHEFNRKRVKILDLTSPVGTINGKRFTGCELMGPANLLPLSSTIISTKFNNCDFVLVSEQFMTATLIRLEDVQVVDCSFWECTWFVPPNMEEIFKQMGVKFLNQRSTEEKRENVAHKATV